MKSTAGKRLPVAIVVLLGAHEVSLAKEPVAKEPVAMLPVDVQDVVIADSFWAPRMQIIRENMIPHSWNHVQGAIQELRCVSEPKAAKPEPEHRGRVKWREAKAVIDGQTVLVSATGVAAPKNVRFGWQSVANPNLMNQAQLPASPFQTDNWRGGTGE